jgi:hypothetical protein
MLKGNRFKINNYKIDLKIKEIICVKLKDDYSN